MENISRDLSIVIPCYNEGRRLSASLARVTTFLASIECSTEVILVDDGSKDNSLEIIMEAVRGDERIRFVALPRNCGKGRAVAEGIKDTNGNQILLTDADLSTPLEELTKLQEALQNRKGVAFASRAMPESEIIPQPFYRVLMGKTFNYLVQKLLLPGVLDTQCGFKLFQGDLARDIFLQTKIDGFAFDVEVLALCKNEGGILVEVPVKWVHSPQSTVSPIKHSLQTMRDLILIKMRLGKNRNLTTTENKK